VTSDERGRPSQGDRLPITPAADSKASGVEWNLEILLGSKYFAAEGLLSRD